MQRALLLPLLLHHILYHKSLLTLEKKLNYSFHDRQLLEVLHELRKISITLVCFVSESTDTTTILTLQHSIG